MLCGWATELWSRPVCNQNVCRWNEPYWYRLAARSHHAAAPLRHLHVLPQDDPSHRRLVSVHGRLGCLLCELLPVARRRAQRKSKRLRPDSGLCNTGHRRHLSLVHQLCVCETPRAFDTSPRHCSVIRACACRCNGGINTSHQVRKALPTLLSFLAMMASLLRIFVRYTGEYWKAGSNPPLGHSPLVCSPFLSYFPSSLSLSLSLSLSFLRPGRSFSCSHKTAGRADGMDIRGPFAWKQAHTGPAALHQRVVLLVLLRGHERHARQPRARGVECRLGLRSQLRALNSSLRLLSASLSLSLPPSLLRTCIRERASEAGAGRASTLRPSVSAVFSTFCAPVRPRNALPATRPTGPAASSSALLGER